MEKAKRKRDSEELLPASQRYLPLIILLSIWCVQFVFAVFRETYLDTYDLDNLIFRHYWLIYIEMYGLVLIFTFITLIPIAYTIHISRRRERYNWTWELGIFILLSIPTFCGYLIIAITSIWLLPSHITTLDNGSHKYHVQYFYIIDKYDSQNLMLYRCDLDNNNCIPHVLARSSRIMSTEIKAIELTSMGNAVAVCVINEDEQAYLTFQDFSRTNTDTITVNQTESSQGIRSRLIWDNPVENHPQCNAENIR